MRVHFLLLQVLAVVLFSRSVSAHAEDPSSVVATVDNTPITKADVDREIAIAFPNRTIDPPSLPALQERTTEQLIRRQLVLRYLRDQKQLASPSDVALAVERLKKQLAQREESWDDYLKQRQLDESQLQRALSWQISWGRFLEKYLSDSNLQRYFEKHKRDFDGTELRVAHILMAVPESADAEARMAARQKAVDILGQIRSKQISFEDAARQHSAGSTREKGGDIGFISRREPMPEPFSKAAFALELQQVSEPVETTFGFHLIRCLEVKPGQKKWTEVRSELEPAVTEYLFNWAADQARPQAKVERK